MNEAKDFWKSKTIGVGALYMIGSAMVYFGDGLMNFDAGGELYVSIGALVTGLVMIGLRFITKEPVALNLFKDIE